MRSENCMLVRLIGFLLRVAGRSMTMSMYMQ